MSILGEEYGPWTGEKYRVKEEQLGKFVIQYSTKRKKWIWFGEPYAEWNYLMHSIFYMRFYRSVEAAQQTIKELEAIDQFVPKVVN